VTNDKLERKVTVNYGRFDKSKSGKRYAAKVKRRMAKEDIAERRNA